MNLALQNLEARFLRSNPAAELPPTWQVIYQEGIRGNHILFSPMDLKRFSNAVSYSFDSLQPDELVTVEEEAFRVMTASNYEDMSEIISDAEFDVRLCLFHVYKRLLSLWSSYLKENLH